MIEVERVDYIRVPVQDIEQAKHFYGELLGLELNPNSPSDDWLEYEAGNVTLAIMTPHTHEYEFAPLPPSTIALRVPDLEAARAELVAAGLEPAEMWDSGLCNGVGVSDPAGNRILLHRRYAPYPDGTTP
jgi:catechol 2,3-dioxygenase-like lactoylglutathione lyase family enzyme